MSKQNQDEQTRDTQTITWRSCGSEKDRQKMEGNSPQF